MGYHRANIKDNTKVSPSLGLDGDDLEQESDSRLIHVIGIIWFHTVPYSYRTAFSASLLAVTWGCSRLLDDIHIPWLVTTSISKLTLACKIFLVLLVSLAFPSAAAFCLLKGPCD